MLPNILISIFYTFAHALLSVLPQTGFPTTVTDSINGFFSGVYAYNSIFPIDTVITVIGLCATFFALVLGFEIVKWIIHLVRGN